MIWPVGMKGLLVLVVVGVVGIGWYSLGGSMGPNNLLQFENMARIVTAVYLSQKYDVSAEESSDTMTPQEMEERAKRIQAESQLAELQGSEEGY